MQKIKAIGFDYGGVIGGGEGIGKKFVTEVCNVLQIEEQKYREVYFSLNHLINTGKVASWRDFWQVLLLKLDLFSEQKQTELTNVSKKYAKTYIHTDQKIIDLIDHLRSVGYKVGLLSNATKENAEQMRKINLDAHFDAFLISAEIGIQKPNPSAFAVLAEKLQVNITELAFIDDATMSLSTAETCGFTPILFTSYEELIASLSKLQII